MKKSTHTVEYLSVRKILQSTRNKSGLSQRSLAVRLGVSPSWVAKVENGERRIDIVELRWFIAACGADISEVLAELEKEIGGAVQRVRGKRGKR